MDISIGERMPLANILETVFLIKRGSQCIKRICIGIDSNQGRIHILFLQGEQNTFYNLSRYILN